MHEECKAKADFHAGFRHMVAVSIQSGKPLLLFGHGCSGHRMHLQQGVGHLSTQIGLEPHTGPFQIKAFWAAMSGDRGDVSS